MTNVCLIDVFCAHQGQERGLGELIGIFSDQQTAILAAKDKGWYGGNGDVVARKALRVSQVGNGKVKNEFYLLDEEHTEPIDLDGKKAEAIDSARKAALKKLSPEEIAVLGIKV